MKQSFLLVILLLQVISNQINEQKIYVAINQSYLLKPNNYFDNFSKLGTYVSFGQNIYPLQSLKSDKKYTLTCKKIHLSSMYYNQENIAYLAILCKNGDLMLLRLGLIDPIPIITSKQQLKWNGILILNQNQIILWNQTCIKNIKNISYNNNLSTQYYQIPNNITINQCIYRPEQINSNIILYCWNSKQWLIKIILYQQQIILQIKELPINTITSISYVHIMINDIIILCSKLQGEGCLVVRISQNQILQFIYWLHVQLNEKINSIYIDEHNRILLSTSLSTLYYIWNWELFNFGIPYYIDIPEGLYCYKLQLKMSQYAVIISCNQQSKISCSLVYIYNQDKDIFIPQSLILAQQVYAYNKYLYIIIDGATIHIRFANPYEILIQGSIHDRQIKIRRQITKVNINNFFKNINNNQNQVEEIIITIKACEITQIYIDKAIEMNYSMSYSQILKIDLSLSFKGNKILFYQIDCKNCFSIYSSTLLKKYNNNSYNNKLQNNYNNNKYNIIPSLINRNPKINILSFYNRQKCKFILKKSQLQFYRIIETPNKKKYIEQCSLNNLGYICYIIDIRYSEYVVLGQSAQLLYINWDKNNIYIDNTNNCTIINLNKQIIQIFCNKRYIFIRTQNQLYYSQVSSLYKFGKTILNWIVIQSIVQLNFISQSLIYIVQQNKTKCYSLFNNQLKFENQFVAGIKQQFIIPYKDYILTINSTYITKYYLLNESISKLYQIKIDCSKSICSVCKIFMEGIYLIIVTDDGNYHLFNVEVQSLSTYLSTDQGRIIDTILLNNNDILLAFEGYNFLTQYIFKPQLILAQFPFDSNIFINIIDLQLKIINNTNQIQQTNIFIYYDGIKIITTKILQQIYLPNQLIMQYQIQNINQNQFYGIIQEYFLSDNFSNQIILKQHLQLFKCQQNYYNYHVIHNSNKLLSKIGIIYNETHIALINSNNEIVKLYELNITNQCLFSMQMNDKCGNIIILCDKQFIIICSIHSNIIELQHQYQINKQIQTPIQSLSQNHILISHINNNSQQCLSILILKYSNQGCIISLNYQQNYTINYTIKNIEVINSTIIMILTNNNQIVLFNSTFQQIMNINLITIIPIYYGIKINFKTFIIYYTSNTGINFIIFAYQHYNAHLDCQIIIDNSDFEIKNIYLGYPFMKFNKIITIKKSKLSYEYFIVQYKDIITQKIIIAYYDKNIQSNVNYIRSTQTINAISSNYIIYEEKLLLFWQSQTIAKINIYNLSNSLSIILSYKQKPSVSYIVLHFQNHIDNLACSIPILFINNTQDKISWYFSLVGFAIVFLIGFIFIKLMNKFTKDDQFEEQQLNSIQIKNKKISINKNQDTNNQLS